MTPDPEDLSRVKDALHYVPFIGLAIGQHKQPSPIVTRLVESAIIGGVLLWGTVKVIGNDIEWIKRDVTELTAEVRELRHEVYRNANP